MRWSFSLQFILQNPHWLIRNSGNGFEIGRLVSDGGIYGDVILVLFQLHGNSMCWFLSPMTSRSTWLVWNFWGTLLGPWGGVFWEAGLRQWRWIKPGWYNKITHGYHPRCLQYILRELCVGPRLVTSFELQKEEELQVKLSDMLNQYPVSDSLRCHNIHSSQLGIYCLFLTNGIQHLFIFNTITVCTEKVDLFIRISKMDHVMLKISLM